MSFPSGTSGKEPACQCRRHKRCVQPLGRDTPAIPWRRVWQPTPVFWPREFHGLYSPWGHKELDTTEQLSLFPLNTCKFSRSSSETRKIKQKIMSKKVFRVQHNLFQSHRENFGFRVHSGERAPVNTPAFELNLSKLQEMVKDRQAWHGSVRGVAKSWT